MTGALATLRWRSPHARSGGLVLTPPEIERLTAALRDLNAALQRDSAAWRQLRADLASMRQTGADISGRRRRYGAVARGAQFTGRPSRF